MTTAQLNALLGTLAKTFVVASLTTFIASGGDIFATSGGTWKTIVSAGVGATAVAIINWLDPNYKNYGKGL